MKIHFWGAIQDVTGSMTFLEIQNELIMIDCGLAQGCPVIEKLNLQPLPFETKEISSILITHAHLDHTGYLPKLVKDGFRGKIYCTPQTKKLMKIILDDSANLDNFDLYEAQDVNQTMNLVSTAEFNQEIKLQNCSFHFQPAGHILGAASIVLECEEKKIIFSGDLGRNLDPILPPHPSCPKADVIVMESTYGGKIRTADMKEDLKTFIEKVKKENRIGIIASFAVARGQVLLKLMDEYFSLHPEMKVRVVMDSPMMKKANQTYLEYLKIPALTEIDSIDHEKEWKSLQKKQGPLIVLASSGMLTGGRIMRHLYNWHENKNALLFLPGYQGEGTPGRMLLEGHRSLPVSEGEEFIWQGDVMTSSAFSSHADENELLEWLGPQSENCQVYLLHGEEKAKLALKDKLKFNVQIATRGLKVKL